MKVCFFAGNLHCFPFLYTILSLCKYRRRSFIFVDKFLRPFFTPRPPPPPAELGKSHETSHKNTEHLHYDIYTSTVVTAMLRIQSTAFKILYSVQCTTVQRSGPEFLLRCRSRSGSPTFRFKCKFVPDFLISIRIQICIK